MSYRDEAIAFLRQVIADTGESATALARRAGVNQTTFTRPLNNPEFKYAVKFQALKALSDATGIPLPSSLLNARDGENAVKPTVTTIFLPIRFRVQAGAWYEVDGSTDTFIGQPKPVAKDPRYSDFPQWLEEVVGDSVNLKIPEGGLAHVVDAIALGYAPRNGDYVVVERRRSGGHIRERTIKQVAINGHGVELRPRSSNPRWSDPIRLDGDITAQDEIEVEIVGLVIGAYLGF